MCVCVCVCVCEGGDADPELKLTRLRLVSLQANSGIIIDDAVVKEFEKMRGGKPDTRPAYIFFNFVDGDSRIAVTEIGEPSA